MRAAAILIFLFALPTVADDPKPAPKFADVAWLAGGWKSGSAETTAMEELWQAPVNGTMAGVFRMCSTKSTMYEFLLLEEKADGEWMRLRH